MRRARRFFIAGTIGGSVLHLLQPSIAFHDVGVAATLVLLGVLLIAGQHVLKTGAALLLFGFAGVVHGYAYGEGVIGAEATGAQVVAACECHLVVGYWVVLNASEYS